MRAGPIVPNLTIRSRPVDALKPHPNNARTHSTRQLHKLAKSIESFGFLVPVLIDDDNRILSGHGRVAAAKQLGLEEVPTIRVEDLSEAQKRAYVIADNRLAQLAEWDADTLSAELAALAEENEGLDFDMESTGFDFGEIDVLISGGDREDKGRERILGKDAKRKRPKPEDKAPEPDQKNEPVSRPGALWLLGGHRLFVGDATKTESYETLLRPDDGDIERVDVVFTDPPYNVPIAGHVSGLGAVTHREFAMASGEMNADEFTAFLHQVFEQMARVSRDGAIHFVCMDWRHMAEALGASKGVYSGLKNLCIWNKDNAGMGSLYRSKHELVFVFKVGDGPHINNVELGAKGRYRTNVWDYDGVNSFAGRADLDLHPTVKPVALIADAIRDCSNLNAVVLDPFAGSGSTLIAAEKTGRRARLIEIDPIYADTIVRRWETLTGCTATDAETGRAFSDQA